MTVREIKRVTQGSTFEIYMYGDMFVCMENPTIKWFISALFLRTTHFTEAQAQSQFKLELYGMLQLQLRKCTNKKVYLQQRSAGALLTFLSCFFFALYFFLFLITLQATRQSQQPSHIIPLHRTVIIELCDFHWWTHDVLFGLLSSLQKLTND